MSSTSTLWKQLLLGILLCMPFTHSNVNGQCLATPAPAGPAECPLDLVQYGGVVPDGSGLYAINWKGTNATASDNLTVAFGATDANGLPAHANAPDNTEPVYPFPGLGDNFDFGTIIFDGAREQGQADGYLLIPTCAGTTINFEISGVGLHGGAMYLGADAASLVEVVSDVGSGNDGPVNNTYDASGAPIVAIAAGCEFYQVRVRFYHTDAFALGQTEVAWDLEGDGTYTDIPVDYFYPVDGSLSDDLPVGTAFGKKASNCEFAYQDANGDLYTVNNNGSPGVGISLDELTNEEVLGVVASDVEANGACAATFNCQAAPVQINFSEPNADAMLYTQVWTTTDAYNGPGNAQEVYTGAFNLVDADGFPMHPNAPTSAGPLAASGMGAVDADIPGGSASNNAEQVIQDGWVAVPPGLGCVKFRIGGFGPAQSSAVFAGGDYDSMTELASQLNAANDVGIFTVPTTATTFGCGYQWIRMRVYTHDEFGFFNSRVAWDIGNGFEAVPANFVHAATSATDNTPPTGVDLQVISTEYGLMDGLGALWQKPNNCNNAPTQKIDVTSNLAQCADVLDIEDLAQCAGDADCEAVFACDPCQIYLEEEGCVCDDPDNTFAGPKPNSVTQYLQTLTIGSPVDAAFTIQNTVGLTIVDQVIEFDETVLTYFVTPGVPYELEVVGNTSGLVEFFGGECAAPNACNCPEKPEVCGDNLDNDCDGLVDADDPDVGGDCVVNCEATPVEIQGKELLTDGAVTAQIWSAKFSGFCCTAPASRQESPVGSPTSGTRPQLVPFKTTQVVPTGYTPATLPAHQNGPAPHVTTEIKELGATELKYRELFTAGRGDQAQMDAWLVLPAGVSCADFRVNNPYAHDASSLFLGPNINDMDFLGASWGISGRYTNDITVDGTSTQASGIFSYDAAADGVPLVTPDPACPTCQFYVIRARVYSSDVSAFSISPVQWNIGDGWENVPSRYLQSVGPTAADADTDNNKPGGSAADLVDLAPFCAYTDADGDLILSNGQFYALNPRNCEQIVTNDCLTCPDNLSECEEEDCVDSTVDPELLTPIQENPTCNLEVFQVTPREVQDTDGGLYTQIWDFDEGNGFTSRGNERFTRAFSEFNNAAPCPGCLPEHPNDATVVEALYPQLGIADNLANAVYNQNPDMDDFRPFRGGFRGGDNAQQDGWLVIPNGVDCIDFRMIGGGYASSALYLGNSIDEMTLVGEVTKATRRDRLVETFTYQVPADAPTMACAPCGDDLRMVRIRFYHHDNRSRSNTIIRWNIGRGYRNIPTGYLRSVPDECSDALPTCPTITDGTPFLAVQDEEGKWFDYASFPNGLNAADVDPVTNQLNVAVDRIYVDGCDMLEPVCGDPTLGALDTKGLCAVCIIPGLAKTIANVSTAASGVAGNVDITWKFTLTNVGGAPMENLVISDNFTAIPGFVGVSGAPEVTMIDPTATAPNPNAGFAGNGNIFDGTSGSLVDEEVLMAEVTVEFDASEIPNTLTNSAMGGNDLVLDTSDAGTNPDPENPNAGVSGDTSDPADPTSGLADGTLIFAPAINAAKNVSLSAGCNNASGNMDAVVNIEICNTGNIDMTNITLVDEVQAQLGASFLGLVTPVTITSTTATATPNLDASFDGMGATSIFDGTSGTLAPGECVAVQFTFGFDPNAIATIPTNQAITTATAVDPVSGTPMQDPDGNNIVIEDLSDDGDDTDSQNPTFQGDTGGSNDPSPLTAPNMQIAKHIAGVDCATSGESGNFDVIYEVIVMNTGNVNLTDFSLLDNMTDFGAALVAVVEPASVVAVGAHGAMTNATANPTPNAAFGGNGDDLLTSSGELAPGERFVLQYRLELDTDELGANPVNQIAGSATGLSAGTSTNDVLVTDLSDSGFTPEGTNADRPGDTGGHCDPTPLTDCYENSTIACNDNVQVSLDATCIAALTPDMFVEGYSDECGGDILFPLGGYYDISISLPNGTPVVDGDLSTPNQFEVDGSLIGVELTVEVTEVVFKNSCWGTFILEDKLAPVCDNTNDVTITCEQDPSTIAGPTFVDNCSAVTVELENEITTGDICAGTYQIERSYVATDAYGNTSTEPCVQTITVTRTAVDFPANDFEINCTDYNNDATLTEPSNTGFPAGVEAPLCNYAYEYNDQQLESCGSNFKIVRTWTVLDWCTGELVIVDGDGDDNVQVIKIVDTTAPMITATDITLSANEVGQYSTGCTSTEFIPAPIVSDDCNEIVSMGIFTEAGELEYVVVNGVITGGNIPAPGLGIGTHTVTVNAEDACGNIGTETFQLTVVDDIAPTAVCDEITDVSLSTNGYAEVAADNFDDGSNDNCGIDKFEVRRMTDNCGIADNTAFGPSVTFCCEDVANSPVMIQLRVYDASGNYNDCMVQVIVEDKLPPVVTNCPAPQAIDCDFYLDNLSAEVGAQDYSVLEQFGTATFIDNCALNIDYEVVVDINTCSEGTITRTWTATDDYNTTPATCTQVITVNHVSDWSVAFPEDQTVNCLAGALPAFGEPVVFDDECELIGASFEDQTFTVVTDACYKVVRTWSVINWCLFDQFGSDVIADPQTGIRTFADGGDGFITYTQVIKVIDDEAPSFTIAAIDGCIVDNTCQKTIVLPYPTNVDECSDSFEVDIDGDLGAFNDIQGDVTITDLDPGTYTVFYNVTDECGNFSAQAVTVEVSDCKKPTPYCVNGIILELMAPGMIDLWASDLDAGSFDNCTAAENLKIYFNNDPAMTSIVFDCDAIGGVNNVELWVEDEAGNKDFCIVSVTVQNNADVCEDEDDDGLVVSGLLATSQDEAIADATVELNGGSDIVITENDGLFSFENVATGEDVTITPMLDNDYLNGVTTYDLVLISKHILGVSPFDSPYEYIAADANNSGSVTTYDMVLLRRLILMIDTELANNTSWRFVDAAYVFPIPTNPWAETFPEVINYNNISESMNNADFVGVKIGDINGSVSANGLSSAEERTNGAFEINSNDQQLTKGAVTQIEFLAASANAIGFQFTLEHTGLELLSVDNGLANAEHFGLEVAEEAITASWNSTDAIEPGTVLFTLNFQAMADLDLRDAVAINSSYTKAEAYGINGELLDVNLTFNGSQSGEVVLYQNQPNPFDVSTSISFQLPAAAKATLVINDVDGKKVQEISGTYAKGMNTVLVDNLPSKGVYYYTLSTGEFQATKKMVVLK